MLSIRDQLERMAFGAEEFVEVRCKSCGERFVKVSNLDRECPHCSEKEDKQPCPHCGDPDCHWLLHGAGC